MKKNIFSILITLLIGFIWFYFNLPAINIHSFGFWFWISLMLVVYALSRTTIGLTGLINDVITRRKSKNFDMWMIIPFGLVFVIFVGTILVNVIISPIFMSKKYANRIDINMDAVFSKEVPQVDFNALPLLDKDSSQKLGDRVMGQMPEMVSQFYVSSRYTQINYNNNIVRVTPLEYNGFFKYINNHKSGVTGYITVNSVTGESKLIKLDKGMKYMPSAIFGEDLYRKLRFSYPTLIFGYENFEIDNDGNPYWTVPVLKYSGVGLLREVVGLIILDPITGDSKKYDVEDVPTWVDHVFESDLIIEQVNDWGLYNEGFVNSLFGQKNVVMTTSGYNYTVMNDDVYLYTGITSVANDEANIGFIMTNMRTKETNYYAIPGAEEYSAMASAEGQIQQMSYTATFPLLINLNNKPTYLISLKDNAGLVKMYAFVDVVDYQKVVVSDASMGILEAAKRYLGDEAISSEDNVEKNITIKSISNAVIDGNTFYYIMDSDNNKYRASIKINKNLLPFLNNNDKVKIWYKDSKDIIEISKIQ